ncbi:hypothetical protein [Terriglobus tenax]|uniref:hypothetical protein n=1 Tax=Terriglobus tenax TaxID=1111115 RepID=UPI0021E0EDF2|nr:hypothetical protein [Terriglobus tenax]
MGISNRRVNDPSLTRQRGLFSHPGTLFVAAMAILFSAYIFNVGGLQTRANASFDNFNQSAQSHNDSAVRLTMQLAPPAAGLVVLLLVYWALKTIARGIRRLGKEARLSSRDSQTQDEFCDLAAESGVSRKVATHTYRALQQYYHGDVRSLLHDRLREDLHMTEIHVYNTLSNLLHRSDRKKDLDGETGTVLTVIDLMQFVEKAPLQFLTHSAAKRVRGDQGKPEVVRTAAMGETRMVKPLHKRSGLMAAVKNISGMRKAAAVQKPVEPRDPVARPVNPPVAVAGGREVKRDITVPRD